MILNFSNHPARGEKEWLEDQTKAALDQFGGVVDYRDMDTSILPHNFPQIDPSMSSIDLKSMAQRYASMILSMNIFHVHVMGEQTFCFYLINILKQNNIKCYASTTKHESSMVDNIKTSEFTFCQFREY